jgi:diguanylate cyclase (GGDEF)-like protein
MSVRSSLAGLPTLAMLLRRGQLRVTLVTLLAVASVLTVSMLLSLRWSQLRSLDLVARSIAYTAEAAIVFQDRQAVGELLEDSLDREGLAEARVVLAANGQELAGRRHAVAQPWLEGLIDAVLPLHAQAEVRFQGRVVARVMLRGDPLPLLGVLGWSGVVVALGSALGALLAGGVARRMTPRIEQPLRELAQQSHDIWQARAFERRNQGGGVREVAELAEDFNRLLAEVHREAELLKRHDSLLSDHDRLRQRAQRDALTGVFNRAHFEQCLARAVERARAQSGCFALLFIDADGFKQINDVHGHEAGDRVLVAVAQRLRSAVREQDAVARMGGDEFVLLIDALRQPADAGRVVEQIEAAVAQPVALSDSEAAVRVVPRISVGVAMYPVDGDSAEALMRAADAEMYARKRQRRQGERMTR